MAVVEVRVPSVGESIREGVLDRWLVPNGGRVERGAPLFELATDKTNTEVPATESGVVTHLVAEGTSVEVGASVASIDPSGTAAAAVPSAASSTPAPQVAPAVLAAAAPAVPAVPLTNGHHPKSAAGVRMTPLAARILAELHLDPARFAGHHGRVRSTDVLAMAKASPAQATVSPVRSVARDPFGRSQRREALSPLRRAFLRKMHEGRETAAILSTMNEFDMTAVEAAIGEHGGSFAKRHGASLTPLAWIVKACAVALREHRRVNARIEGAEVLEPDYIDIAVTLPAEGGSISPVLRNADSLSAGQIAIALEAFAKRAAAGALAMEEMEGATFTVDTMGMADALFATPPLNTPQTGTLGLHKTVWRAAGDNGRAVPKRMMYATLAYDHRLLDGKDAVLFLVKIKEGVERLETLAL